MTVLTEMSWHRSVTAPATEFGTTSLPIVAGTLPTGLRGSLYRNGPARMERGGVRVGHWFDGDGAILGVHFGGTSATGVYRYVQTAGLLAEERAGRLLHSGYGTRSSNRLWEKRHGSNAANTSVLAVGDKLLALWEAGLPHALDPVTLETRGLDHLGGLSDSDAWSAHPKVDPDTGDIYNFGVQYGRRATLKLYRSDATGAIRQRGQLTMSELPMIHDFCLAGPYLLFFVSPVRLNPLPLLTGLKSYSDSLSWKPERGTLIIVVDRATLAEVARHEAESFYQWHFGNGSEKDGIVTVDMVRYPDFTTNASLGQVASGPPTLPSQGHLYRMRVNARTAALLSSERVMENACEFPEVDSAANGRDWHHTWMAVGTSANQDPLWFDSIGRFDHSTGRLEMANLDGWAPTEPIHAVDSDRPEVSYILDVVYEPLEHRSEVWIFDAHRLSAPPLCRLALPQVIPIGFHGTWRPQ